MNSNSKEYRKIQTKLYKDQAESITLPSPKSELKWRWSPMEIEYLKELAESGITMIGAAICLNRSYFAVLRKTDRLGIRFSKC
jgi:hypothetical protein